jgi:hypothetical protein
MLLHGISLKHATRRNILGDGIPNTSLLRNKTFLVQSLNMFSFNIVLSPTGMFSPFIPSCIYRGCLQGKEDALAFTIPLKEFLFLDD